MSTTKMKGTYHTLDDYLTVTFDEVKSEPDFTNHENIQYFESGEEITCSWLVKKYGQVEAERFILGAIRNAKSI